MIHSDFAMTFTFILTVLDGLTENSYAVGDQIYVTHIQGLSLIKEGAQGSVQSVHNISRNEN